MQYVLCRIEDDSTTTEVGRYGDVVEGCAAGRHITEVEDWDYSYGLYVDGVKVASFADGRIGYREWARRTGRLQDEYIHSLDDKYDHDVEVIMS